MNQTLHLPRSRGISLLAALAMALTMLVASPTTADAHQSTCSVPPPAASGLLAEALAFANVFAAFVNTDSAECEDKSGVEVKLDRDWVSPASRVKGNGVTTYAPCEDGMSADFFECDGIDLMSHVSLVELGLASNRSAQGAASSGKFAPSVNDIWGWTDTEAPGGPRDYALLGAGTGTVFVDITDALRPKPLGILPTASSIGSDTWRDIKVYEDHAFIVSEHFQHGVQVFDLTRLRAHKGNFKTYDADAHYTEMGAAHNIFINEDTGYAYALGSSYGAENIVSVAGNDYDSGGAGFGAPVPEAGFDGPLFDVGGVACDPITDELDGTIAIIDRGACRFDLKATNAQAAGAIGVIIVNNQDTGPIGLGGDASLPITIPVVSLGREDGAAVRAALPADASIVPSPPSICGDGLHIIDVSDPTDPTYAGCEDETGYVHDTQCVVYEGPDEAYQGKEICFNSNGIAGSTNPEFNKFSIVDVSDKSDPVVLSRVSYEGSVYSHQGWLTEDQGFFLFGDELDEVAFGDNTSTRVWDVSDLTDPKVINQFFAETSAIDHNIYTEGDLAYASNYEAGLRIYDASNPAAGLSEVAFFDMYPEGDAATFDGGTWSNYPWFAQDDIVAVSSVDRGLFILRIHEDVGS